MNGLIWLFVGAITGWLIGILLGEKGYGKIFSPGCARGLDIFSGIAGAATGHYILLWSIIGDARMLSNFATAVLGAAALVGICRLATEKYLRSPPYGGVPRLTGLDWHEKSTEKTPASSKP